LSDGNLFAAFDVSASGLTAQRARLNVVAANLANAQTTRTAEGGPYRRRVLRIEAGPAGGGSPLFEQLLEAKRSGAIEVARTSPRHLKDPELVEFPGRHAGVSFDVTTDTETPGRLEYDPGHPDANADGYVEYPNVDVVKEMVELMAASRAYEANVTTLNATKAMIKKALEI
jgi:flagellar basal-body rod protein FlgC